MKIYIFCLLFFLTVENPVSYQKQQIFNTFQIQDAKSETKWVNIVIKFYQNNTKLNYD